MLLHSIVGAAALFTTALAADLDPRAACNRDNCLRQVVASNAAPGPAKGSADCQSFMTTTFTPCASTATATAPAVIVTVSDSTTITTTTTLSITSITTVTTTTVTTTTTTSGPPMRMMARANEFAGVGSFVSMKARQVIEARATTSTPCGTLTKSTSIPTYASNCLSPSQYSSACVCDGITATTVTKPASTTTTTTTPTTTTTITNTATNTITITTTASTGTSTVTATKTSTLTAAYCTITPDTRTDNCGNGKTCKETTFCFIDNSGYGGECANTPLCGDDCSGVEYNNGECFVYTYCC